MCGPAIVTGLVTERDPVAAGERFPADAAPIPLVRRRRGVAARIDSTEKEIYLRKIALTVFACVPIVMSGAARLASQPQNSDESVVLVGAGDIANCEMLGGARATAALLDKIEGTVFTLGDHAYPRGTAKELKDCYEPTWGRHKARTRPTLGNHDLTDEPRPALLRGTSATTRARAAAGTTATTLARGTSSL